MKKNNVFVFTGEEKFLVYQELKKRKKGFIEKYGRENLFEFKSDEIDAGAIINCIFSGGLFVSKKLVIIFGIPKDTDMENKVSESKYKDFEEKILNSYDRIPDDVILLFVSFTPDKRLKFYKFIIENANIKTFDKLKDVDIRNFILNKLGNLISREDADYIIELIGSDLFAINNEIDKLKIYAESKNIQISKDVIQKIVYPRVNINVFSILDKMLFDKNATMKLLQDSQSSGQDQFEFLGLLYWGIKSILQIIDLVNSGIKDSKVLAGKIGLHPFVVAKNLKIIDKLLPQEQKIKQMFLNLINLDYSIKTGKIPGEIFWLEIKKIIL